MINRFLNSNSGTCSRPALRTGWFAASLSLSMLLLPASVHAASLPPMGTAAGFGVLAASTATSTGPSIVTGDLGVSPGTAVTGFPPGIVTGTQYVGVDSAAGPAQADALVAYNDAAGQACDTNLTGQDLGGMTLTPGVYCFDSSAGLTGTLTLDFLGDTNAVFIFQTDSTLTTAANSSVVAINGPPSCNHVIWQIGSSATLGSGTTFLGDVLADASISAASGASNSGGFYALNGAVTLISNLVAACGAGPVPQCATDAECVDDANVCTDIACSPGAPGADFFGCVTTNNAAACDDQEFCNGADVCSNGTCGHAGDPCLGGGICGASCNEGADNCFAVAGTTCRAADGICDLPESCTGAAAACPADLKSTAVCRAADGACDAAETCDGLVNTCPVDGFVASSTVCRADTGACDLGEEVCTGSSAACPADGFAPAGTECATDNNTCTNDLCNDAGVCGHTNNALPCNDNSFCTTGDACSGGTCSGPARDCGDGVECTVDSCNESTDQCVHAGSDAVCDDDDDCTTDVCNAVSGCVSDRTCGADICRTPGYWGTHGGYEKKGTTNVTQAVLDAVGGLEICGETVTTTSNMSKPYLKGLGLSSALESMCVKVEGDIVLQLYRQLTAAALNCAMSTGSNCDEIVDRYIDVSFSECNALCEFGTSPDSPSMGQCIEQLDCFNNGGRFIDGTCAFGSCAITPDVLCGKDGACPTVGGVSQVCVKFANSCHAAEVCNETLGVCPKNTAASSSNACREAAGNTCVLDACN